MSNRPSVLILGSGPAGLTAAIYAARAGLQATVLAGVQPGGQLTITTDVENYPGFAQPILGPELMVAMEAQAQAVGADIRAVSAVSCSLQKPPFLCKDSNAERYLAQSLIIATGAVAKWLNVKGESELRGFGVSACATCDAAFFKNQRVAVIGGGNTAVEEALFLTRHASKVYLIHRRDKLRAEKILQDKLFANRKIFPLWNSEVAEMIGSEDSQPELRALRLRSEETSLLEVEGAFVAIGHTPATELFRGQLSMDAEGYIHTEPDSTKTSIAGVFAAGDVRDRIFRQAVTAAGLGCMAALEAEAFLS